MPRSFAERSALVAAAVASFALSLALLPHSPGMGDSAELTLALALAGIAHPTGYPLYTLVGHFFVRLAHATGASWIVAANLWSALGAAVAAGACVRVLQHVAAAIEHSGGDGRARRAARGIAIAIPFLLLLFNPVWIESATIAEVYSWNNAMLAIAAAFMLGRLRDLDEGADAATTRRGDFGAAATWGLISGISGTLHATSALFIVPFSAVLIGAWVRARRWKSSLALVALGAALIPMASYLWIPWRAAHPAAFQWPAGPSLRALWLHMTGAAYRQYVGRFAPSADEWTLIRGAVLPWILPGLMLGPILAFAVKSRFVRLGVLAILIAAALQVAFIVRYGVPDPAMYFLPTLLPGVLIAVPILLGLSRRITAAGALVAGIALVGAIAAWSVPRALSERANLDKVDAGFRDALRKIPFPRGIVLWADDHYQRFKLLQILEGQRPRLYVENPDMLIWPARRRAFIQAMGFDPLSGLDLRTPADLARIPDSIRRQSRLPVLVLPQQRNP
ncbi:MAG TPA: DUF2723 domain-containing protein [Candidatus Udaeobacter sp.]|nr:DUF2723 domain-containing protein [Candidatus Udaeobacter sp.]